MRNKSEIGSVSRAGYLHSSQVVWNFTFKECGAMIGVAEIHLEVMPEVVFVDAHIPRARDGVGKLPEDVKAFLVGEPLAVGLDDSVAALPQSRAQRVERVTALLGLRPLQVLEGIDGLDLGQIFRQPRDTAFRLAILNVFEEVGDLVLAGGAIGDGVALDYRDFDFVVAGEQQRLPFFFFAGFEGEAKCRVCRAENLCELFDRWEGVVLRQNSGVVGQFPSPARGMVNSRSSEFSAPRLD